MDVRLGDGLQSMLVVASFNPLRHEVCSSHFSRACKGTELLESNRAHQWTSSPFAQAMTTTSAQDGSEMLVINRMPSAAWQEARQARLILAVTCTKGKLLGLSGSKLHDGQCHGVLPLQVQVRLHSVLLCIKNPCNCDLTVAMETKYCQILASIQAAFKSLQYHIIAIAGQLPF